jgi:hypothetical protein
MLNTSKLFVKIVLFRVSNELFSSDPTHWFQAIVTDQLDARSREALLTQKDPATMHDSEVVMIRKTILHLVYGN